MAEVTRATTSVDHNFLPKMIRSHEAEAIDLGADLYDHIHDHRHYRSTWRQDATRARTVIFAVAERSEKR